MVERHRRNELSLLIVWLCYRWWYTTSRSYYSAIKGRTVMDPNNYWNRSTASQRRPSHGVAWSAGLHCMVHTLSWRQHAQS